MSIANAVTSTMNRLPQPVRAITYVVGAVVLAIILFSIIGVLVHGLIALVWFLIKVVAVLAVIGLVVHFISKRVRGRRRI